jgi:spore germination cell wall hydrolase CwlJ-like protein
MTPGDLDIGARTVFGEARGEEFRGQEAVAEVLLNRMADARWPDTLTNVCKEPRQFSCWNTRDVNYTKLLTASIEDDPVFRQCYKALLTAMNGGDITFGANHYFATWLDPAPSWSKDMRETCVIGIHRFFRAD